MLKAILEIVPRTPVDYRIIFSVNEARISVFSGHVPVMRVNLLAPTAITIAKETQMLSLQVGSLQTYFMSEPEMLFAFVKTFNSQIQSIFLSQTLRQERSLRKLRELVSDQLKIDHKIKLATNYNSIFNNLADDGYSEAATNRNGVKSKRVQVIED